MLFWSSTNDAITKSSIIYNCFNDVCCIFPDGDTSKVECNTKSGYYGPLCGGCDKSRGYYRNSFVCEKCRSNSDNWTVVAVLAVAAFFVVVYVSAFHRTKRDIGENGSIVRRIAYSYVQSLGVLGIFKARGTKVFYETVGKTSQAVGGSLTSMLAIKCLLQSQIYGTFLFTMALPFVAFVMVCFILFPWTLWKRHKNNQKRKKDFKRLIRRRSFVAQHPRAKGGDEIEEFVPPQFEPLCDCPKFGSGLPDLICRKVICFRRDATEEYLVNSERKWRGEYPLAPEYRPRCAVHEQVMSGVARACLMMCPCNRVLMTDAEKGVTRAERAMLYQRIPFKPAGRLTAVMILVMYSLFPSLVASTTSIFNCSDAILGRYYLIADLTVTCYDGWHLVYMLLSTVCVLVFCLGTPVLFTLVILFDFCTCTMRPKFKPQDDLAPGAEIPKKKTRKCGLKLLRCICHCNLRSDLPWSFRTPQIRERFGLLVVGYDVSRGSLVMAWEPMIGMSRKLLITLAGTLIRDPYIQIMTAQLILIISLTLQATVQPYESRMLNMLDILSVLVLVITQILSILFLYLDTLEGPLPYESFGLDRTTLETGMTVLLFFTNVGVVVLLYLVYAARMAYEKCGETKRKLLESRRDAAEASGNVSGNLKSIGTSLELISRTKSTFAFKQKKKDVALQAQWYDAHGIEIGDVVSHPALGTNGVVCGIDIDDDESVHIDFGTKDSEGKEEILNLDDWLEISSAVGFSINRPAGFISGVAARLERDSRAAQLRGDFVEFKRLELQFKMLTLPSAIKKIRAEMAMMRISSFDIESSPPLPDGWVAHENDDGDTYYHNSELKKTTWDHPGAIKKKECDQAAVEVKLSRKERRAVRKAERDLEGSGGGNAGGRGERRRKSVRAESRC